MLNGSGGRSGGLGDLMLVAQASGAQVKPFSLAIDDDNRRVDIGFPAAVGMALRVADIMAELR